LKVAVYTIALNEAAHAERWASSAVDADYRVVADTGSIDDTAERLRRLGVTVHQIAVRPWRFDDARNTVLALLPSDVDVCLSMDMDEFLEPGWRAKLEAAWSHDTTALHCQLARRSSLDDPMPKVWPAKKFHQRWGYRFKRAVHEALFFTGENEVAPSSDILIHHVQDRHKGTRAQYLPLLEVAHREDPDDAQICFWLGRDYMWAEQHERSVEVLQRYLVLPSSGWPEERAEAMRCLARMQPDRKMHWLDKARTEAPHRREVWLDLAEEFYGRADWLNLFWAAVNGTEKTHRTGSYLDDPSCWGARLYDLAAIACWHLNIMDRAVEWGRKALELIPGDQRLQTNLTLFMAGKEAALSTAPRTRLFTSWGTMLYVDTTSGELRHGAIGTSPENAALVLDPIAVEARRYGWLAHELGPSSNPIACLADHSWSTPGSRIAGATATAFQLVQLDRGILGLRSGGLYLCAEPDERLTLCKPRCSLWECFVTQEEWAPPLLGTNDSQGEPVGDTTIDWPGIRQFIATHQSRPRAEP
jgi:glycosyltransferase involved in cell wall biosynthesis